MTEPLALGTGCYIEGEARKRALDSLASLIRNDIGELEVTFEVAVEETTPVVTLSGADATVARNLLRENWGERTVPKAGEIGVGTLESWDSDGFVLDAGESVRVPTAELGLGPGTPSEVRTRFGLVQHLPLRFVAGDPHRLADVERDRLYE